MAERVGKWVKIPDALMDALKKDGRAAGMAWAKRTIEELRELKVPGVHLYPLGRPKVVEELLVGTLV